VLNARPHLFDIFPAVSDPPAEFPDPPATAEQLLPLVYEELRLLAARKLAAERPGQTLQPTALVHEAYLKLAAPGSPRATGPAAPTSSPPPPRRCAAS
jgi:hypothetical protein